MKSVMFVFCLCLLLASCEPRDVIRDAPPEEPILTLAEEEPEESVQPVVCRLRVEVKPLDKYRDIPLSHELQDVALAACEEYGVLPDVLFAVMEVESGYQLDAQNGECYGLMQIHSINLPWLQEQIGVTNLSDPAQNIEAGAYILGGYLERYSLTDSLMAYNLGEGGAKAQWEQGIHETAYTRKVLACLAEGKEEV